MTSPDKETREALAAIEHERWADWQKWLHSRLSPHQDPMDDQMCMTGDDFDRWERQIKTPYSELSDREKASDMEQVDRYWPLIEQYVATSNNKLIQSIEDKVVGPDETHPNGSKIVNPWRCDDCASPQSEYTRNQLRAEQRAILESMKEPV